MSESPKISNAEPKEPSVPSEGQSVAPMAEDAGPTPQTAPQTDKYAKLKHRFDALKKVSLRSAFNQKVWLSICDSALARVSP